MEKGRIEFDDPNFRARKLATLLGVSLWTDDEGHTSLLDNQHQSLKDRYRRVRCMQDQHGLANLEAAICDQVATARKQGHDDDIILKTVTDALLGLSLGDD